MRHDPEAVGGIDQRIPGDAGGGLIRLAESAVDDDQLPAGLQGALPLLRLHGHVPVDDVAVVPLQAELLEDLVADLGLLIQRIVGVLGLGPGRLVLDEPPLEGGHAVLAEDGAVAAGPQEPEEVHAQLLSQRSG